MGTFIEKLKAGLECFTRGQRGFSFIETLICVVIFSMIATAFMAALSTGSKVAASTDERETAKNLAESQMEIIKQQTYSVVYAAAPVPEEYAGYSVVINTANVASRDPNIQKITVVAQYHGKEVFRLEDYKTR